MKALTKRIAFLILIARVDVLVIAQDVFLSQYTYSSLLVNPANVNLGYDMQATAHVRNQYRQPNPNFTTPSVSLIFPFVKANNKRWGGLGVSALADISGSFPQFSTQGASLSYAHDIQLKPTMHLSLGVQGGYYNAGIFSSSFSTSSQYSNANGYNQNMPTGETSNPLSKNYFDFSTGILWHGEDTLGRTKYYLGISFYHLNQPTLSIVSNQSKLPFALQFHAGIQLFEKTNWSILPEIFFKKQDQNIRITGGVRVQYLFHSFLDKKEYISSSLAFIPKYHHKQGMGFGLELKLHNLIVAINYDYATSAIGEKISQNGAYEFVLGYRKSLFKIKEKELLPEYDLADLRKFYKYDEVGAISNQLEKEKANSKNYNYDDTTWHKSDNYKFELEKRFTYGFNEVALGEEAKKFADDLAGLLKENTTLRLAILGYSDAVGSEKVNLLVSKDRAKAFAKYIEAKGVNPKRVRYEGKGETEALNTNRTKEERARNRRIRFLIY